tara:strand:- start:1989 stop:2366 length:378 start_codon:yes stop_codon:yes gene_type:complete
MFTKKRKEEICRQIYINNIFDEFHKKKLYSRKKLITNYQQALAMALSISSNKCLNLNNLKKDYLVNLKVDDLLRLIKTKELEKMVKQDKYYNDDIKKYKTKKELYSKYFNKTKFINKLVYHLKHS